MSCYVSCLCHGNAMFLVCVPCNGPSGMTLGSCPWNSGPSKGPPIHLKKGPKASPRGHKPHAFRTHGIQDPQFSSTVQPLVLSRAPSQPIDRASDWISWTSGNYLTVPDANVIVDVGADLVAGLSARSATRWLVRDAAWRPSARLYATCARAETSPFPRSGGSG